MRIFFFFANIFLNKSQDQITTQSTD